MSDLILWLLQAIAVVTLVMVLEWLVFLSVRIFNYWKPW